MKSTLWYKPKPPACKGGSMISMTQWIEVWLVSTLPLVAYLLVAWYAWQLGHQPQIYPHAPLYWRWSCGALLVAVAGASMNRIKHLFWLWNTGRQGAFGSVDLEFIANTWLLALGLLAHAYLMSRTFEWFQQHARREGPH